MRNSLSLIRMTTFLFIVVFITGCQKEPFEIIPLETEKKAAILADEILTANFYVSTNGNDNNPGTFDKPFATWQKAFNMAQPGNLVYIRGGVYTPKPTFRNNNKTSDHCGVWVKNKSGKSTDVIKIWAYPGEVPIMDLKSWNYAYAKRGIMIEEENNADYWHLKGLKIRNISQQATAFSIGIFLYAADNIKIEDCETSNIGGPGMYGTNCYNNNPNDNTFINCDSHDNYDNLSATPGGNADGFQMYKGSNTKYINCRSWSNSDDGWDFYSHKGVVTLEACWAFNNGIASGDGCGFKLGSKSIEKTPGVYSRVLKNCIAFYNKNVGFYENQAHINMYLVNNTSFNNGTKGTAAAGAGFQFYYNSTGDTAMLINNASYNDFKGSSFNSSVINKTNTWNNLIVKSSDFITVDTAGVTSPRFNGNLPQINFLKLTSNSNLIDKGTDVGINYLGIRPDLGAFEKR